MATRLIAFISAFLAFTLAACQRTPAETEGVAYLVRHAEKVTDSAAMIVDDPLDPPLSEAGEARAEALADLLKDRGIDTIWSTDYKRTRDTAAPLANRLNLGLDYYDPRALEAFAEQLQQSPSQTVLIVGHSNTTPALVAALGGEPGPPIDEATEYDRFYIVNLRTGATEITSYGAANPSKAAE